MQFKVDMDGDMFLVHALIKGCAVETGDMDKRVTALEGHVERGTEGGMIGRSRRCVLVSMLWPNRAVRDRRSSITLAVNTFGTLTVMLIAVHGLL